MNDYKGRSYHGCRRGAVQEPELERATGCLPGEELQSVPGIPAGDGHKCS